MKTNDFIKILNDKTAEYLELFLEKRPSSEGFYIEFNNLKHNLNINSDKERSNFINNLLKLRLKFKEPIENEDYQYNVNVFDYIYTAHSRLYFQINSTAFKLYKKIRLSHYKLSCFYGIKSKYSINIAAYTYKLFNISTGGPANKNIAFKMPISEFRNTFMIPDAYTDSLLITRILIPLQRDIKRFAEINKLNVDKNNKIISFNAKLIENYESRPKNMVNLHIKPVINTEFTMEKYINKSLLVKLNFDMANEIQKINNFFNNEGFNIPIDNPIASDISDNPNEGICSKVTQAINNYNNNIISYHTSNNNFLSITNNRTNHTYKVNKLLSANQNNLETFKRKLKHDPLYTSIYNLFSVFFSEDNNN